MLYIVQVVLSGSAEKPQIFSDEAAARDAFVTCVQTYWAKSYAAHCEVQRGDRAAFSSAQSFVASFDLADRSRVHFWTIPLEGAADATAVKLPDLSPLRTQQEHIERLADDLERATVAVQDGLAGLAATIAALGGEGTATPPPQAVAPDRFREPTATAVPAAGTAPQPAAKPYDTREWRAYVAAIQNMCGGNRQEYHLFTRQDWRQAIYSGETSREYWEWVAETIDHHIEAAQQAGCEVIPDPDKPGRYLFMVPGGEVSDVSSEAEGEAWCRAGQYIKGKGAKQNAA
jgi:hypothetical protein